MMDKKELNVIIESVGNMNLRAKDGRWFEGIQLRFKIIQEIKRVDREFKK